MRNKTLHPVFTCSVFKVFPRKQGGIVHPPLLDPIPLESTSLSQSHILQPYMTKTKGRREGEGRNLPSGSELCKP